MAALGWLQNLDMAGSPVGQPAGPPGGARTLMLLGVGRCWPLWWVLTALWAIWPR